MTPLVPTPSEPPEQGVGVNDLRREPPARSEAEEGGWKAVDARALVWLSVF